MQRVDRDTYDDHQEVTCEFVTAFTLPRSHFQLPPYSAPAVTLGILTGESYIWFATGELMASIVEQHYQSRMDSLSAKERMERCAAMFQWTRQLLGRQIVSKSGAMSPERLKWEVAKRLYSADPSAVAIIDRKLADVSR